MLPSPLTSRTFHHPKRRLVPIKQSLPIFPHPLPSPWQSLICFLSICMHLYVLYISYKMGSWYVVFCVQLHPLGISSLSGYKSSLVNCFEIHLSFPLSLFPSQNAHLYCLHLIRCKIAGLGLSSLWSISGAPHWWPFCYWSFQVLLVLLLELEK